MTFIIFILILVVLILVHEFGHFIVAKAFKIRVDEFGIFFPPRIAGFKWGETLYTINWLPFGGFVKIFGEDSETPPQNVPRNDSVSVSFAHKPRLVQAAVVVAGIIFNLLLAWVLLAAGYMYGIPTSADHKGWGQVQNAKATIVSVLPGSPAEKAGLMAGDIVESALTGTAQLGTDAELAPPTAEEVQTFIGAHQNESLGFTVSRNGERVQAIAKPVDASMLGLPAQAGKKVVGVELGDVGILKLPPHTALLQGALLGKDMTVATAGGLAGFFGKIFQGSPNFTEVSGPIGIVGTGSTAVKEGFISTILLTALISINLAILNLIPIPGLDGGRLLFIAIESVTRKPISHKLSLPLTIIGFGLLILLMLVASYHDVVRLVTPA